jgi:hypothetical protein
VLPGEEFYEYDTYKTFIWDGFTWRELSKIIPTTSVANSTASGTIDDVGEYVECDVSPGAGTVGCQLTGKWATVGNLIRFEATTNGTDWEGIYTSMGASAVIITGQNGIYQLGGAGYVKVRVMGYAGWTIGNSCIVNFNSTVGTSAVVISTPLPQGTNTIGNVGTIGVNEAQVVYEDGDILYVCKAIIGALTTSAVWQIKKVDGMDITWCDGNALYDNVATSLAIVELLSYS